MRAIILKLCQENIPIKNINHCQYGHKKPGQPPTTYVDILGKDIGLTTEELEATSTMKDRSVWRAIESDRSRPSE